jgi:hypothetical protein
MVVFGNNWTRKDYRESLLLSPLSIWPIDTLPPTQPEEIYLKKKTDGKLHDFSLYNAMYLQQ